MDSANRTKNISIQLWTDLYYCRVIGIWYPSIENKTTDLSSTPMETTDENMGAISEPDEFNVQTVKVKQEADAPYIIVSSSMFTPRREVLGGNPIARGQSPMPKEFIETAIRNMSYLFANEIGMFQPETKAIADTFLAKQKIGYTLQKEVPMTVTPVQGSMSLKDLKGFINQYSEEEQETIKVISAVEKPETTAGKHIEEFTFADKMDKKMNYITITTMHDIYETEDPYIVATQLPLDPEMESMVPGVADAPGSQPALNATKEAIELDTMERETLKTFDDMNEQIKNNDIKDPNDNGNDSDTQSNVTDTDSEKEIKPKQELTRVEVLEELLKQKNQQLIDAKVLPETLPVHEDEVPKPLSEAEQFKKVIVTEVPDKTPEDLEYERLTSPDMEDMGMDDINDNKR